jgi:rubrerythrin
MFLIAGVSPKTTVIDNTPRRCPVCGTVRAYYKRVDHYFNLFFIPILRVKKGEPFIMCDRCPKTVNEFKEEYGSTWPDIQKTQCHHCGKTLAKDFGYCPYCGKLVAGK